MKASRKEPAPDDIEATGPGLCKASGTHQAIRPREIMGALKRALRARGVTGRDLEDVIQEVFVQLLSRRGTRDGDVFGYALCVARGIVANSHRADDRRARREAEVARDAPNTDASIESRLALVELKAQLFLVLPSLRDEVFRVVVAHWFHDKSIRAIAEEMRIPVGSVKSRLRAGRQRLRSLLEELVQDPDYRSRLHGLAEELDFERKRHSR